MKKYIFVIAIIFCFFATSIIGCAPRLKYSRADIPDNDPVYDILTIEPAPTEIVEAALAAHAVKTTKSVAPGSKDFTEFKKQAAQAAQAQTAAGYFVQKQATQQQPVSAKPNQNDYKEFKKSMAKAMAEQKKAKTKKINNPTFTKKRNLAGNNAFETRLAKIEKRVNYAIQYGRENRNRIGLLEDRFDLSPSGNIKAKLVLFRPGSAELSPDGEKTFNELIEIGAENVRIAAHASVVKGKIDNQVLSQQRAETVNAYLLKGGIKPEDITVVGETDRYGENKNISVTWE